jgi:hypothetical protein
MKTIAIRVSDEEHKLFTDLAEREFMPLSVLVRRTLRAETVRVGLMLDPAEEARRVLEAQAKAALAPQKPVIEPKAQVRKPVEPPTNPYAHLPSVDDVMFDEYPVPEDNPPPDA